MKGFTGAVAYGMHEDKKVIMPVFISRDVSREFSAMLEDSGGRLNAIFVEMHSTHTYHVVFYGDVLHDGMALHPGFCAGHLNMSDAHLAYRTLSDSGTPMYASHMYKKMKPRGRTRMLNLGQCVNPVHPCRCRFVDEHDLPDLVRVGDVRMLEGFNPDIMVATMLRDFMAGVPPGP